MFGKPRIVQDLVETTARTNCQIEVDCNQKETKDLVYCRRNRLQLIFELKYMSCIIRWSLLKDISIYYSKTISVSFRSTVKERPDILQGKLNRSLSISSPWFELFTEAFPRRNCPSTLRHCFASGVVAIENTWRASFELLFQHFISITGSQGGDNGVEEEKL